METPKGIFHYLYERIYFVQDISLLFFPSPSLCQISACIERKISFAILLSLVKMSTRKCLFFNPQPLFFFASEKSVFTKIINNFNLRQRNKRKKRGKKRLIYVLFMDLMKSFSLFLMNLLFAKVACLTAVFSFLSINIYVSFFLFFFKHFPRSLLL